MKPIRLKILFFFCFCFLKVTTSTFLSKIPQKYISDSNFISMTLKTPNPQGTLYASPKGHGSSCTSSNPCTLSTAVEKIRAGYTLYLKGGEYNVGEGLDIEKGGEPNRYIVITSVKGETPIITSKSKNTEIPLFTIEKNLKYIIIENLIFKNVKSKNVYGIALYEGGQNHIIIRNNEFTSLQTTQSKDGYDTSAVLLIGERYEINNVMIYNNKVTNNHLGYGEAISIMGNCVNIYVLNNTLTNNNNIAIDFNGNTGDCKTGSLDQPRQSVAMYNKVDKSISPYADCAGIYVDGAKDIYIYDNIVANSQYGIEVGAENNDNKNAITNILVENNKLIGNTKTGIRVGGYDDKSLIVRNTVFKSNHISKSPKSIIISKSNSITIVGNKIYDATIYFIEMEKKFKDSIKNIIIQKNEFSGTGKFLIDGKNVTLQEFVTQYNTNKIKS